MGKTSEFTKILLAAKSGEEDAIKEMIRMYNPLLIKNAIVKNVFDDDLYQELCLVLLECIRLYEI